MTSVQSPPAKPDGRSQPRRLDISGQVFGRLRVIEFVGTNKHRLATWLCRCECGAFLVTTSTSLRSGRTSSCGCFKRDKLSEIHKKHGLSNHRLKRIWSAMKQRCGNTKCDSWIHYGGRGISVCPEWINDFSAFANWALNNGYEDNLSIDRIDNDDDYRPDNCRWATRKDQSGNTSKTYRLPDGRMIRDAAKEIGMNTTTLRNRIWRGWPIERALNHPVQYKEQPILKNTKAD